MSAESIFKKVFLEEVPNMICPERLIDAFLEESKNMDFSKMHDKMPPELVSYLDDNFVNDPALSSEENLRNGFRRLKEFWCIKQKQQ